MGEYSIYVYPAYLVTAIVLVGLLVQSIVQRRARRAELTALERRSPGAGRSSRP